MKLFHKIPLFLAMASLSSRLIALGPWAISTVLLASCNCHCAIRTYCSKINCSNSEEFTLFWRKSAICCKICIFCFFWLKYSPVLFFLRFFHLWVSSVLGLTSNHVVGRLSISAAGTITSALFPIFFVFFIGHLTGQRQRLTKRSSVDLVLSGGGESGQNWPCFENNRIAK